MFTLTGAFLVGVRLAGALFTIDLGFDGVGLLFGIICRVLPLTGVGIVRTTVFTKGERLIDLVADFDCDTAFLYLGDFLTDLDMRFSDFFNENPKSP